MKNNYPIYGIFEVTSKCNYNCKMCYNIWKMSSIIGPKDLNKRDKFKVVDILTKYVKKLVFTGGEPLIVSYLSDLISKTTNAGVEANLITNASLVNDKIAKKMKVSGLKTIQISFHHKNKKTFNEICGNSNAFSLSLKGAKILLRYFKSENILINMVPLPETYKDVYSIGEFLYILGFKNFVIGPPVYSGNVLISKCNINIKMLKDIYNQLIDLHKNFHMNVFLTGGIPFCVFKDINREYPVKLNSGCEAGGTMIAIGFNGRCRACVEHPIELDSILTMPLKKVWQSKILQDFRDYKNIPQECKNCTFLCKCRGGCRVSAFNFSKKFNGKDHYLDEFIKQNYLKNH